MREMYWPLLIILYASVFLLFMESWIVFRNMKTRLHAYLFFSCVACLVNNLGYALEMQSRSYGTYITALKLSYAGRIWLCFSLFMFVAEFTHHKIPYVIRGILPIIHVLIYATILTLDHNELYYKNMGFSMDASLTFPIFHRENGPAHHLFIQMMVVYIALVFYWLVTSMRKQKSRRSKDRHMILLIAMMAPSLSLLAQVSGLFDISRVFDLTMIGNVIMTFFMYLAIFRFNLLGIIDIARDFMIDRLSEGVIAVDNDGKVQYYNEPALALFPELKAAPQEAMIHIKNALQNNETINANDRIYTPEENDLTNNQETLGKIYSMMDATELKKNEYKLKADAEILEMAARSMKDRLLTTEELMKQDRALRHDRRHFEALLLSLLQDGKSDEARKCLEERLAQEPHASVRYCDNTTVNAALTHYVAMAELNDIKVTVKTNIPSDPGVDEMKLAIAISNLIENAINACEKIKEGERFIDITARYREQLLLEVVNSCDKKVELDENGFPYTEAAGHGIGTRSVLAFAQETDSEIMYIAEDKIFKVRMIIG